MYSKSGGHEVFQDKYMLYSGSQLVGNSIRVNKISRIVDNATQKYDGNIYLSTMCILNAGVDYSQFTLTIDAYTFDSTTPLKSVTKTIEVVSAPSVDMSINGRKYVAVAKGTYVDLKVTSNMDDVKIEYKEKDNTDYNGMTYNKLTGKLYVGVTEGEYKIQATVTKTIHDRKFEYTDTLHVIVVPYVVTGINVDRVTNGRFIGNYNQPYILSVSLTANYAPIYKGAVATALNQLADAISKDLTHTFYLVSGSRGEVYYENIIGGGQYADFHIEEKDGYFVLRNNVSNPTSRLGAQAVIDYELTYDKNGKANGCRATKNPETMSQYAEYINCEFVLEFSRLSTLDNPEPIFTAQELLNMRAGGHYILLSDITLSPTDTVAPFTAPIDTAIGSLDGNDYIITISGFPVVQSDNIGLFSTIYADSIIKNLTIEIPFNEELTTEVESGKLTAGQDLYVDVTQNETTRFGILAGTNNGIVTNALVVNPAGANAIRTSREKLLGKDGEYKYDGTRTTSIVRVSSNITPSAQSRIAGLVGVNSGYITKSSVQNVSIFGDNFVSGFVCENSSIIGTSSAVGVNVSASASPTLNTALGASGFVLINNKNASIVECMVEGATNALYHGTNDDNKIDMGGLVRNHNVRNQNTFVNSTANATGFVFNNEGSVTDCYSNVVILGTLTSGFVFANGEDGKIQGAFDLLGIKYTGTGYLSSAISMNKNITKLVMVSAGVPMPSGIRLMMNKEMLTDLKNTYSFMTKEVGENVGFPCIVKPCCGGSSVGVSIAEDEQSLVKAFDEAFAKYDVIIGPAAPTTAPKLGSSLSDPIKMYLSDIYTISLNLAGLPGMTITCGTDSKGLPIGMQLIGDCFKEKKLIQTAYTYEQAAKEAR